MMPEHGTARAIPPAEIIKSLVEHVKENNAFIRHYEDVRFNITQINVTLSVLLIGASRFATLGSGRLLLALFIVALGVHGSLVCGKYTERADRHATLSRAYRKALSEFVGEFDDHEMEKIHKTASDEHQRTKTLSRLFLNMKARWFWIGIHVAVIVLGVFVAVS